MTAAEAKSGKYTYYVCHSLLKRGSGPCKTPRLNAKSFEELIVTNIRETVLTESNIRDLVKLLDEEMDGVAAEQRERLESIDEELEEVKRRLGRIWNAIALRACALPDWRRLRPLRAPTPKDGGGEAECLGGRQRAGMYVHGQQPRSRCGCAATTGGSQ